MKSEREIRAAIDRIEASTFFDYGSHEEEAGAVGALRWVLGEDLWLDERVDSIPDGDAE